MTLKTYTGERVPTLRMAKVIVTYKDTVKQLQVVVVAGSGQNLLGWDWLRKLEMNCLHVHKMEHQLTLHNMLQENEEVFKEELGVWRGPPAKIHIKGMFLQDSTNLDPYHML